MNSNHKYGKCPLCEHPLAPIWFKDQELDFNGIPTGRERLAVSYLFCPKCAETVTVDDSFDQPWK